MPDCPAARAAGPAHPSVLAKPTLLCWAVVRMRPRTFCLITMMVLCHSLMRAQVLTNALPPSQSEKQTQNPGNTSSSPAPLPDDPGQEAMPIAEPETAPQTGVPVSWKADRWTWVGHTTTLYGVEDFRYRDYVLRADKVVYNQETTELQAEGHLQLSGGPGDLV